MCARGLPSLREPWGQIRFLSGVSRALLALRPKKLASGFFSFTPEVWWLLRDSDCTLNPQLILWRRGWRYLAHLPGPPGLAWLLHTLSRLKTGASAVLHPFPARVRRGSSGFFESLGEAGIHTSERGSQSAL